MPRLGLVHRWRPFPVGSRLMIARYRHLRAACSAGKWPRAFTPLLSRALIDSIALVVQMTVLISRSKASLEQLQHAVAGTEIVCVQNLFHLADRTAAPLLDVCLSRGIAFVPFCPLGWPRGQDNPVLTSPVVVQTAARLGIPPAQAALLWLLQLAPNVLLIPGPGSVAHLRENLAAEEITLDDQALRDLDRVSPASQGTRPATGRSRCPRHARPRRASPPRERGRLPGPRPGPCR
jgi:pyridoxine 4-dehydrogenase